MLAFGLLVRYAIVQYSIWLYLNGDHAFRDQRRKPFNFDPTIETLVTMIIYMVCLMNKTANTFGNESRLRNVAQLPKAEQKLFNYIKMSPIFREPGVQDLVEQNIEHAKTTDAFGTAVEQEKSFDGSVSASSHPQSVLQRTVSEDNLMALARSLIKSTAPKLFLGNRIFVDSNSARRELPIK